MVIEDLSQVRTAVEGLGFRRMQTLGPDILYRHVESGSEAAYFAQLTYRPAMQSYGVQLGVTHPPAMEVLKRAIPVIESSVPAVLREHPRWKLEEQACWNFFDAGRVLGWPTLGIPDPDNRDSWHSQVLDLDARLLKPLRSSAKSAKGILDLLLRDDGPYEWKASNAVLRVAQVIALTKLLKLDWSRQRMVLSQYEDAIKGSMHGGNDVRRLIEQFADAILT